MDSFATIVSFFTTAPTEVEGSSLPTNEETSGSGGNAYCVVAWASGVRNQVVTYFIIMVHLSSLLRKFLYSSEPLPTSTLSTLSTFTHIHGFWRRGGIICTPVVFGGARYFIDFDFDCKMIVLERFEWNEIKDMGSTVLCSSLYIRAWNPGSALVLRLRGQFMWG